MSAKSALTLSIREFARRDGCDESRVRQAIRSGHLKKLADGNLDAALVRTGWRETNRRNASRADTSRADTATRAVSAVRKQRTPHPVSAPAAEIVPNKIMMVPMEVGPNGMHPLAIDLWAMAQGAAMTAAPILLRHLPLETAQQIVGELTTCAMRAAVDLLEDDDVPPPAGMASWAEHPYFAGPDMTAADWADAVNVAAAAVRTAGATPDA